MTDLGYRRARGLSIESSISTDELVDDFVLLDADRFPYDWSARLDRIPRVFDRFDEAGVASELESDLQASVRIRFGRAHSLCGS